MTDTVSTQTDFMDERITKLENTVNQIQMKLLNVEASISSTVMRILKDYWSIVHHTFKNSGLVNS